MHRKKKNRRGDVDNGQTVTIRIAPDGRLFLHDLTPGLLPVIQQLNPGDELLDQRLRASTHLTEDRR